MKVSAGTRRKMDQYQVMLVAQEWARANKVPNGVKQALRDAIEHKQVKQIKSRLDAISPAWYPRLRTLNASGAYQIEAPVIMGVAYPNFIPKCFVCGVKLNAFGLKTCGSRECRAHVSREATRRAAASRSAEDREAIAARKQATLMRNYGVNSPMLLPGSIEKLRSTISLRTPEENAASRAKRNETLREKLGEDYEQIIQAKAREGLRAAHRTRGAEILDKMARTMESLYGAAHPMQVDHIRERAHRFRQKSVRLGNKTYKCQGYEPIVLRALHAAGWTLTTSAPGISYKDAKGVARKYYPDILAKSGSKRLIVEVKSEYTYKHTLEHNPNKLFAGTARAKECGADFVLIVVHPNSRFCYLTVNPRRVPTKDRLNKYVLNAWALTSRTE